MSELHLATERLVVRPWRHEEAERLLDIQGRLEVVRWLGTWPPTPMTSLDEAHERIDGYHRRSLASDLGFWAVEVRDTGEVAGSVLLLTLPGATEGEVEIGWHLHPDSQGHGYAREAARAVLGHAWTVGLPEVWALTHLDNYPSQAVARSIGMTDLGLTDRWYGPSSRVFRATRP